MRHGTYVFVPENAINRKSNFYYGWVWEGLVIIVGRVSSEVSLRNPVKYQMNWPRCSKIAEKRLKEINSLLLNIDENFSAPGTSLTVLNDLTTKWVLYSDRWKRYSQHNLKRESETDFNYIAYRLPNLRAQRFYTVKPLQLDLIPKSEVPNPSHNVALLNTAISADSTGLQLPSRLNMPSIDVILDHVSGPLSVSWICSGETGQYCIACRPISTRKDSQQLAYSFEKCSSNVWISSPEISCMECCQASCIYPVQVTGGSLQRASASIVL
jgi:hypothetical protein